MHHALRGAVLIALLIWPVGGWAQVKAITYPASALQNGQTGNANGGEISIDGYSSISVTATIAGTATVNPEVSQDQVTWAAAVCVLQGDTAYTPITTIEASGVLRCNIGGYVKFRARTSGNSGTVSVTATASPGVMGGGGGAGGGGVAGWPVSAITKILTWANSFLNALGIGGSTNYWAIYEDTIKGLQFNCVIGGTENACHYIRELAAGFYWEIRNHLGASIFRVDNDTGTITNATLDGEGSGNTITLTQEQWFNVVSCQNTTPSHIHDTPTTNIPQELCDTGSNTQKGHAAFDATTDESIRGHWVLPVGFTGAIDVKGKYKIAATSGAVGWCFQMVRVPDGATSDPALPAQASGNCVSDTVKGTTLQENDFTISGVTCTSCAAGDHVYWSLSRDANGDAVTDDATGDAFLSTFGRILRVAH